MSESNPVSDNVANSNVNYRNKDKNKKNKRRTMGNLPSELLKFVKNESYSLLIKGKPGTGKTTFALTLLDNLNGDSNYFYISTRLSLKQLSFYYPWIEKFFSKEDNMSGYRFEDARLDEPESLFERITNQLMDVKSPVIIIDTWDTIASFMDRESRLNNERVLQIWRERAGAKLIFLSETFDLGILDSIVDGVITFENRIFNSNNHRQLTINKLRGVPIRCYSYSYSLFQGVFYTLDLIKDLNLFLSLQEKHLTDKKFKNELIKVSKKSKLALNVESFLLDNIFFGNKFVTINADRCIDNEILLSLILKPLYFWLSKANNNKIMINNFEGDFRDLCKKMLSYYMQDDEIQPLDHKLLTQEIDFGEIIESDEYKIHAGNINKEENETNYGGPDENKYYNSSFEKYIKTNELSNPGNDINILNILNGFKLSSILNESNFLKLLEKSFTANLIVLNEAPTTLYDTLLEKGVLYEFNMEGKNISIRTINKDMSLYGAVVNKNRLFIDWRPVI